MANITALLHPASGNSQRGRNPYYVDVTIDLTTNSIAPGDTIQAITCLLYTSPSPRDRG